jgi:hypothetical protein
MKAFIRQEDTHLRLEKTVCMYKGVPVYCAVSMDFPVNTVHYCPIETAMETQRARYKAVLCTSDEFSAKVPELGYLNYDTNAWYLTRVPERKQRQGLVSTSVVSSPNINDMYDPHRWFFSEAMKDLLTNQYPTRREAIENVMNGIGGIPVKGSAFHKHCAIVRIDIGSIGLHYRGRLVATYDPSRDRFTLLPDLKDGSFLQIILGKIGVDV